jgi:hypothetical protein
MALFNKESVLSRADLTLHNFSRGNEATESVIIESALQHFRESSKRIRMFDIFLSHSYADRKGAIGIKKILEDDFNYTVYIDWLVDRDLNRGHVTSATAARIKSRMKMCKCLFYVTSSTSSLSKWMPWETGLMDGLKDKVTVCPFTSESETNDYKGLEYLGIYPYVTIDPVDGGSGKEYLWINRDTDIYVDFDSWLNGHKPIRH